MRKQTTDTKMKHSMGRRLQRLALGGALAALLAVGAAGAGVQGDPSQWDVTAGDPSQWGRASRATSVNDPQAARGSGTNDPMTALNFTKIEYKNSALNFTKIETASLNFTKVVV